MPSLIPYVLLPVLSVPVLATETVPPVPAPPPALLVRQAPAGVAETPAPAPIEAAPAPAPASALPAAPGSSPAAATASHKRRSWEEHFAQANTAHDGHLTLEEAKAGYKTIARYFNEIDATAKGFVTLDDIRAWHALRRASKHTPPSESALHPQPAFQPQLPADTPRRLNTSATHTIGGGDGAAETRTEATAEQ